MLSLFNTPEDPRWANPIKNKVRYTNLVRKANEQVDPSLSSKFIDAGALGPLRVVNGMSTATSSTLTTAARENFSTSPVDGLPGRPGNSTIRWAGGLVPHPEEHDEHSLPAHEELPAPAPPAPPPVPKKFITPSLATLEKAVSARIYFENLYFSLFRHTPSREQRRLAMERDMEEMQLSNSQRDHLRARWRQNETQYLREKRRKVDVTAFTVLKTIGHGISCFNCVPLSRLSVSLFRDRCFRRGFSRQGKIDRGTLCHETGMPPAFTLSFAHRYTL